MLNHIITSTAAKNWKLNNKILQLDRDVKNVLFSAFMWIFTHSLDIFYLREMTREFNFSFKN